MQTALLVYIGVGLIIGVTNLFCLIYVLLKMYQEKGILHALVGFFCCTLYPFVWGWLNANRLKIYDIMVFWSAITIFGFIIQLVLQLMGLDPQSELLPPNP